MDEQEIMDNHRRLGSVWQDRQDPDIRANIVTVWEKGVSYEVTRPEFGGEVVIGSMTFAKFHSQWVECVREQ